MEISTSLNRCIIAFLLFILISVNSYGQRNYANNQTKGTTGLCLLCFVDGDASAADGNLQTFSTLRLPAGVGGGIYQEVIFPAAVPKNTPVTVKLGTGDNLLSLTLLGGVSLQAYDNSGHQVGDPVNAATLATVLSSNNQVELTFTPSLTQTYNRVRVALNGGLLGVGATLLIYDAFYNGTAPAACNAAIDELHGVVSGSGLGLSAGSVVNPQSAIDGDISTASTLNVGVGLLGSYAQQTIIFQSPSVVGDSVRLTIAVPPALLSASVIAAASIETYNGNVSNNDSHVIDPSLLSVRLLDISGGVQKVVIAYAPTKIFDRVQLRLGGVASVLSSLNLYEAQKVIPNPVVKYNNIVTNNVQLCSGSTATLTASAVVNTTFNWYTQPTGGTPVSGPSFTTPPLTANATYYVAAMRSNCTDESARTAVTITVNAIPAAPVIPNNNITVCEGQPATFAAQSVTGVTINWYTAAAGGAPVFSGNSFTTGALAATTTYFAEAVAGGTCISPTRTAVTATVSVPPPAPTLGAPAVTICQGDVAVLSVSAPVSGVTYNWYSTSTNGTILYTGENFTTPILNNSTNYYVEAINNNSCSSAQRTQATVTVQPKPADPVLLANNATIAAGQTATITVNNAQTGITYNWYTSASASTPTFVGTTYPTPVLYTNTTYYVAAVNSTGCQSVNRTAVTINVTTVAPPCSFASQETNHVNGVCVLCGVTNSTLAVDADTTTASTITVTAGLLNASAEQQLVFQNPGFAGDTIKIGLQSPVGLADVSLLGQIQVIVYNGVTQVGSYTLDNALLKVRALGGTGKYIVYVPATGNYDRVTVRLISGAATLLTSLQIYYAVQQFPKPVLTPLSPEICKGSTATLNITPPASGTFAWFTDPVGGTSVSTGAGTSFTTPILNSNTTYYIEYTRNGCVSPSRYPVQIVVNDQPVKPVAALSNVVINSGQTATLSANAATNVTVKWYTDPAGGTAVGTGNTFVTPALTANATYYAESSLGNCTSPDRTPITVTVNAIVIPDIAVAPPTQAIGAGTTATFTATSTTPGAVFKWYAAAAGGPSLFTGATFTTPSVFVNTTYYAEASVPATGAVSAARATGIVTINSDASSPVPCDAAIDQTQAINGLLCVLCGVNNPTGAVDADRNTFSQLGVTVGLIDSYAQQTLRFANTGRMGDSVVVELGVPGSLASVGVLSSISLATYNGTTYNGDRFNINSSLLNVTLLNGTSRFRVVFKAAADFDRVEIRLNSAVGVLNALNIYDASQEVAAPAVAAPNVTICQGSQATLTATAPDYATIKWYNSATGGTPLFTGAVFNTPALNANTVYYAEASRTADGCAQAVRTPVNVIVLPAPATPVVPIPTVTVCSGQPATFTAQTVSGITYSWYTALVGGTPVATGDSFTTGPLSATTSYYVEAGNGQCANSTRLQVTANVANAVLDPTVAQVQTCSGSSAVLTATSAQPGVTFNWYTAAAGGTPVFVGAQFETPVLNANTSYYVEAATGTCTSANRVQTDVVVNSAPVAPTYTTPSGGEITSGQTTQITVSSTTPGATFNWYTTQAGGTPIFVGSTYTTPVLVSNTTYYVESTLVATSCVSARTPITITVVPVFSTTCDFASNQTTDVNSGLLCVGCGVNNPINAVDADVNNFSQLNLPISVLGSYVAQSLIFNETGAVGDTVSVKLQLPVSLLSVGVLDQLQIASYNGVTYNNDRINLSSNLLHIQILSGGQTAIIRFAPTAVFDRVEIRLNSVLASLFNTVNVYYASKQVETPQLATNTVNICAGNTATFTVSNARNGVVYNWYDAPVGGTLLHTGNTYTSIGLTATTTFYVESARSSNNCPNPNRVAANANVTPAPVPPVLAANTVQVCAGDNATLTVTNANGATVNWYDAPVGGNLVFTGASFQVTAIANIVYFAELTNGTCNSSTRTAATINVNPLPAKPGVASNNVQVCIGSPAVLQVQNPETNVSYDWFTTPVGGTSLHTGPQYTTDPITQNTSYYIQASSATGCINNGGRTQVNVNTNGQIDNPVLSANQTQICSGGSASISVVNPVSGFTYKWYSAAIGGMPIFVGTTYTVNNLTANATYFVEATNSNGCISAGRTETDITVQALPQQPTVQASAGQLNVCVGSSAILSIDNPQPDLVYRWYTDQVGGTLLFVGTEFNTPALLANATYYVEAASAGNCNPSTRTSVTVTVNQLPLDPIPASNLVSVCAGSSATLSVSSPQTGVTYNWYDSPAKTNLLFSGITYITDPVATTTNYYLAAVNATGCFGTNLAQVQVVVPPAPAAPTVANGNDVAICNNSIATLSITNPQDGYTYNWYNVAAGGAAIHTGTDYATPTLNANATYYVEAVNTSGCVSTTRTAVNVTISQPPSDPVPASNVVSVCAGSNATLSVNSPQTGVIYNWYDSPAKTNLLFTGITYITGPITTTTNYYLAAVNATGCFSTNLAQVQVVVPPAPATPTVANGNDVAICNNSIATLSITNPQDGFTYNWYNAAAGGTSIHTGTDYATPTLNANATYYVEAVNSNGCVSTTRTAVNVTISQPPSDPVAASNVVSVCAGSNATLSVNSPQTGITYNWYDSPAKTNLLFTGVTYITGPITTTTNYYLAAVNATGCLSTNLAQVQATVLPAPAAPTVANGNDVAICNNSIAILSITNPQNGYTYNWYNAAVGGAAIHTGTDYTTPTLNANTTYYVEAVNTNGCASTTRTAANVTITPAPSAPQLSTQGTSICPGSTTILAATNTDPAITINWYANAVGGAILGTGNNFTTPVINGSTTYYAEAVNASGCASAKRTAITIQLTQPLSAPVVTVGKTTTSSIAFQWTAVTGATGYQVSIDNGITFTDAGNVLTYTVTGLKYKQNVTILVRTTGGTTCELSGNSIAVTGVAVNPLDDGIFVPNAFTPNGDGKNDILYVYGTNIKSVKLGVYDQWGELQFQSTTQSSGWDGTYKGRAQPVGVYVYYLEATMNDGQVIKKKGTITLLR